jgi:hypothetical protein
MMNGAANSPFSALSGLSPRKRRSADHAPELPLQPAPQ